MTHEIKIPYKYYEGTLKGKKLFAISANDGRIKVKDSVMFRCFDPVDGYLPLTPIFVIVDEILSVSEVFNIDSELIVFSFKLT